MANDGWQALKRAFACAWVLVTACGGTSLDVGTTDAGETGVGGTSGAPTPTCARTLPSVEEVGCDYLGSLGAPGRVGYCAKGGCHNTTLRAGKLDLTPDDYLVARLLDVPASHELSCAPDVRCDPAAATCTNCEQCPSDARLIDTQNPASSWMIQKMDPFIPGTTAETLNMGCGDIMPTFNTTGTNNYSQGDKDCLIAFFTRLAQTPGDWPCFGP